MIVISLGGPHSNNTASVSLVKEHVACNPGITQRRKYGHRDTAVRIETHLSSDVFPCYTLSYVLYYFIFSGRRGHFLLFLKKRSERDWVPFFLGVRTSRIPVIPREFGAFSIIEVNLK